MGAMKGSTMPKKNWDDIFDPRLLRKAQLGMLWARSISQTYPKIPIAARDTIKAGIEAWHRIKSSSRQRQSYHDWRALNDAMEIGETVCQQIAGKDQGGAYNRLIGAWLKQNDMDDLPTSTRTLMRHVRKHQTGIEAWRNELPPEQKMKMNHPRTIWKHYNERKAAQQQSREPTP
jgi:hypothetical protein